MPREESLYPQDWFAKARQDVRTVEILLREEGDAEVAGFHLQQAVEKYLKGYLLSQGWELERIHNLETLLNEAVRFERVGEVPGTVRGSHGLLHAGAVSLLRQPGCHFEGHQPLAPLTMAAHQAD